MFTDPVQAIQGIGNIKPTFFPITSRYHTTDISKLTTPTGQTIAYLQRRFIPPPENFALLQEHIVQQDDRLDRIAHRYLNDPEQFWRIADANRAMRPDDLTAEIGRHLHITLPEGIPGIPNA